MYAECNENYRTESSSKKVKINTYDTRHIIHKDKRFCAGPIRDELKKILKYESASNYRSETTDKFIKNYGDFEPANLNNSVKLRKIRQQAIYEDLNLHHGPKDLWESLRWMKKNDSSIRELNRYPFHVRYCSDNQISLWKEIAQSGWFRATIDASGSFIKPISKEGKNSGHVFLNMMVTESHTKPSKIIPLCQMLCIRQDTNLLKFWLNDLLASRYILSI